MSDFNSPEDETFFGAIGRLTISWGYVDAGLDILIYEAHYHHDGATLIEPDPPLSLQRKIKYLRKAFRKIPKLQRFSERFAALADALTEESKFRHDVIHGFVVRYAAKSNEAIMVRWPPGEYRGKPFRITTQSILESTVKIQRLRVLSFAAEVQGWIVRK